RGSSGAVCARELRHAAAGGHGLRPATARVVAGRAGEAGGHRVWPARRLPERGRGRAAGGARRRPCAGRRDRLQRVRPGGAGRCGVRRRGGVGRRAAAGGANRAAARRGGADGLPPGVRATPWRPRRGAPGDRRRARPGRAHAPRPAVPMSVRAVAVLPAAGAGRRMGGVRKPLIELAGEPMLLHALRPFLAHPAVVQVIVALAPQEAQRPPEWLTTLDPRIRVVAGGSHRGDAVRNGLEAVPGGAGVVLIHDAARPRVSAAEVERAIAAAAQGVGAVVAVPVVDTLKYVDAGRTVVETRKRDGL